MKNYPRVFAWMHPDDDDVKNVVIEVVRRKKKEFYVLDNQGVAQVLEFPALFFPGRERYAIGRKYLKNGRSVIHTFGNSLALEYRQFSWTRPNIGRLFAFRIFVDWSHYSYLHNSCHLVAISSPGYTPSTVVGRSLSNANLLGEFWRNRNKKLDWQLKKTPPYTVTADGIFILGEAESLIEQLNLHELKDGVVI